MRSLSRMLPWMLAFAVAACGSEEKDPTPTPPDPPVARITGPGSGQIGAQAIFSAEESEGTGALRYHWSLEIPEGSSAKLALEGEAKTAFTPDTGGTYRLGLVVEDEVGESVPAIHEVHVLFPEPVAALTLLPSEAMVGEEITADGSESTDPSDLPLTYEFRMTKRPSGSSTSFRRDGAKALFTPDRPGVYEVSLTVSNGSTKSEAVRSIEVDPAPIQPPVAVVVQEKSQVIGETVVLDGSGSYDPNLPPLPLTYHWSWVSKPEGSVAELSQEDTAKPSFLVDELGEYELELVVDNGTYESEAVVAKVTGLPKPNAKPTVTLAIEGGAEPVYEIDDTVVFVASPFDADKDDTLTLSWQLERPEASEAELEEGGEDTERSLTVDAGGAYTVKVIVSDGKDQGEAELTIEALGPYTPPVADPGEDQSLPNGSTVHLDGTASTHHHPLEALSYQWSFESRPAGSQASFLPSAEVATPRFTLDRRGQYVVGLIVSDSKGSSEKGTVTITSTNRPPVAKVRSANVHCHMGQMAPGDDPENPNGDYGTCALESTSTDPDGDPLSSLWEVVDGPVSNAAYFSPDEQAPSPTFFTDLPGVYEVRLTVDDGDGGTDSTEVTITVDP